MAHAVLPALAVLVLALASWVHGVRAWFPVALAGIGCVAFVLAGAAFELLGSGMGDAALGFFPLAVVLPFVAIGLGFSAVGARSRGGIAAALVAALAAAWVDVLLMRSEIAADRSAAGGTWGLALAGGLWAAAAYVTAAGGRAAPRSPGRAPS